MGPAYYIARLDRSFSDRNERLPSDPARFIVQASVRFFPGIGQTTAAWATLRERKVPNALVLYSSFGKSSPAFFSHTNLLL